MMVLNIGIELNQAVAESNHGMMPVEPSPVVASSPTEVVAAIERIVNDPRHIVATDTTRLRVFDDRFIVNERLIFQKGTLLDQLDFRWTTESIIVSIGDFLVSAGTWTREISFASFSAWLIVYLPSRTLHKYLSS